ncbi:hypothetical protein QTI33_22205 [Variovorax sp. J22P271]|uniref:hypothetical protein n=1 Tax=Variovorax davisae TaxID=3053515 RepID=UPI002575809C|nr:hypothetical protein [Variovorax sp. J22P271]MDM0034863.1 hypothetical protein [Variovorax sp. J22P271]
MSPWPTFRALAALSTLACALTACGGGSSTGTAAAAAGTTTGKTTTDAAPAAADAGSQPSVSYAP